MFITNSTNTGKLIVLYRSARTGDLSRGYSGLGLKLTTHLHLMPRLRMSGAVTLPLLYAAMPRIGENFTFKNDQNVIVSAPVVCIKINTEI
jgi:hypothetical protein